MSSDWTSATLSNLQGAKFTFTLDETGEVVVAAFDSPADAMSFIGNTGPKFDYSAAEGAVRDARGTVVPLPRMPKGRRECSYKECDMHAEGHKQHYIPVLRAMNLKYSWFPIEVVEQDGTKLTFRFTSVVGEELVTGYNHDPEELALAQQYNPDWNILRYTVNNGESYRAILLSQKPLAPCSMEV